MSILHGLSLGASALLAAALMAPPAFAQNRAANNVSFHDDVFPILQARCVTCHQPRGDGFEKSGLDLRTYKGLMKGTKFGPIVVPGDAFTSNLVVLIDHRASAELRMPHGKKKLTTCDRDLIRHWIDQGAKNN